MGVLKITLVQTFGYWHDAAANRALLTSRLPAAGSTDLVLLPEMYATGFTLDAAGHSETVRGYTLAWQRHEACARGYAIGGSLAVRERGRYFNRFCLTRADGTIESYDKRHCFRMADEHRYYDAGKERALMRLDGWWLQPQICYDLRFPGFCRNRPRSEATLDNPELLYDILVYVANWPAVRFRHWRTLLMARAIENQCYVVGLNRIGVDGNGVEYRGDSMVVGPEGEPLLDLAADDRVATIAVEPEPLRTLRRKFPVWQDADRVMLS